MKRKYHDLKKKVSSGIQEKTGSNNISQENTYVQRLHHFLDIRVRINSFQEVLYG